MRKTLHTIVTAAWLGLAGLLAPREAPAQQTERYELRQDDGVLMHSGTLPGMIGKEAKQQILDMAKYEVEKSPFERTRKEFEGKYPALTAQLKPGYGKVMLPQPDGTKKQECAVYLFFDDNNDGIFNIGSSVRPESQEHGLFSIPNNIFFDRQNSPFISACDEHVTRYEKLFEYALFEKVGNENQGILQRVQRNDKREYTSEEWERMKQCVVATAARGIQENKASLELIREGSKIIDEEFARWFSSLENPKPHQNAELVVFKLRGLPAVYTLLFIDENGNGEPDTAEKALSAIKANQMINLYADNCGFEPVAKAQPAEIKVPPTETKATERSKTLKERLMEISTRTKAGEEGVEKEREQKLTKMEKENPPLLLRVHPSFYGPFEIGDNPSPHVPLLADLSILFQNGAYIQIGGGARFEMPPALRNVVFHDPELGIDRLADYEKDGGTGLLKYGRFDITFGTRISDWFFVHALGGVDGYNFDTDSNTGDKAHVGYLSGFFGAGTKLSLVEGRLVVALDVEYRVGNDIKNGNYTKEGKWELPPETTTIEDDITGETKGITIKSRTKEGEVRTRLNLPDQKHPNARIHVSYLHDTGLYLQLVALSEGANVSPMCDLFSCSGMYGRTSIGGRVGLLWKAGGQVYLTGALEGRVETSGIDQFYDYENVPMGGISIGLVITPSEKEPASALVLPEMR